MNFFRSLFIFCLFGSLTGCSILLDGINAAGEKWFADDYVFTSADGTTNRYWNLAKDRKAKLKADSIHLQKFDVSAILLHDTTARNRKHMELTVNDLKQIAAQNQITLFVSWYPACGPSMQSNINPTIKMLSQLKKDGIVFNGKQVGLVMGSISYDFYYIDQYFNKLRFPYQSYIIPSPVYPEKISIKKIFFNRELCPECYATEKDDIEKYFLFAIDKDGKVIDKVGSRYDGTSITPDLEKFAQRIKASIL
ncbi:hypothetical protein I5M27_11515 [Adhaeribacter sp. BT258]|uniref:Uncharacterized protein n=1 Tax=Adhaeribacter terrigena TaxID=2793070 RepID=A0ABS1C2J0_9BACT|nr:hypothetical protein [Adhaeribacter terrigena]MBK0403616.1 hypothetical protein [Adhaeribacter terrigena]